jgi:eukaryotic-like serine/threonine-protein kinase
MPLTIGTKLGPYEILGPLGAGGMGEVYRALDTQLDREVAVKVLPHSMASDPERLARFDREAKILAALNHPNIAVIYGLEKFDGGRALVMELVPGDTLGARIKKGALPQEEALQVAKQIAEALEAAHEKGITHRDLKPGNVMITTTGLVKVLDFGLAAMSSPAQSSADPDNSPTLTMGMTQAGTIMGTAAYMAPEQAAGAPIDRRADIWSYGAVLWEMLTGKRLFSGGESISHTLADVLRAPIDLDVIPAGKVRRLLKRCLDRSLKTRLQSIAEARIAIDEPEEAPAGVAPAEPRQAKGLSYPILATVLGLTAVAFGTLYVLQPKPERPVLNATLLPPDGTDFFFNAGAATQAVPALSPDGTRIVFGARGKDGKVQLWVRRLDSSISTPLPGTENSGLPFWSPDSRFVGFGQDQKVKKIDVQGGPPLLVAEIPTDFGGGSWSPEGWILIGGRGNSGTTVLKVPAAGGKPVPAVGIESGKENGAHKFPWFLPDGKHFLYTPQSEGDLPVRVGSLDEPDKPGKIVAQSQSNVVYAQGHLLYLRESTLMAQPFDAAKLETTGEAVPIAEGVPTYSSPSRRAGFTVSTDGLLVHATGASGVQSRLVWKDRQGKVLGNLGEPTGPIGNLELSPDQKSAAAAFTGDLWIYDTARGLPTRFTFDPKNDREPVWSPDGKTLYFSSDRKGAFNLYRKASNGTGAEELLLEDSQGKTPGSISQDGKFLLYQRTGGKTQNDLWSLPLQTPGAKMEPQAFLQTPFGELRGRFSPDGQWVAYQSNESGQNQVYAAPFPGPGGKRQISPAGGDRPRWRKDGKEIFYVSGDGQLMAAEVAARNGTLEVGQVQKLFDGIVTGRGILYDVSADGQKFLVVDDGAGSARPLTLVQNWTALLKK